MNPNREKWQPDTTALGATILVVKDTGRFEQEAPEREDALERRLTTESGVTLDRKETMGREIALELEEALGFWEWMKHWGVKGHAGGRALGREEERDWKTGKREGGGGKVMIEG